MRKKLGLNFLVWGFLFALIGATSARGDEIYGRVRGTVTDPSGAVIAGTKITATNTATGISKTTTSASDGSYELLQLPAPSTYNLKAEVKGFKTYEVTHIRLFLGQIYVLNIQLQLGQVTQQVTVEAAPAQVEKTSMQLGGTVTGNAIVDLPLNGRDWVTLQRTLPGVVESIDFSDNFSTNGSRSQDNGFMINGNDSNDLPLNTPLVIPSPDAIAEVRMITNTINPEYGRNSGAVLNAVTKSGTNSFHGSGFEFYRDPFLNARNFFLPQHDLFHRNQYGATVGGPIWKDHTFFFFSYQGTKDRAPISNGRGFAGGTTTVLTQDQRNGSFADLATSSATSPFPLVGEDGTTFPAGTPYSTIFPTGHIPAADFSPVSVNLINTYMPLPNFGGTDFSWNPITTEKFNQYITRIDQTIGSKDSLFAYWFIEPSTATDDESFFGGSLPGFGEVQTEKINNMTLSWNHTFGSTTLNEARVGYNRFNFVTVFPVHVVQPSTLGFTGIVPQDTAGAGAPCVEITGLESPGAGCAFGFSLDGPQPRLDQTFQFTDNFTTIKGRHTLKLGFTMLRSQVFNPFFFVNNGAFFFDGAGAFTTGDPGADFLLGIPDFYEQSSGGIINARSQMYYSYFQDQFRMRPNLTLTYGLGWQINTPLTDIFNKSRAINCFRPGQQSSVFPTAPTGLVFPGDNNCTPSGYQNRYGHFGPRFGFAWSPGSSRKWSIRGGAGVYYNQVEEELTLQNLLAPPFSLIDFGALDVGLSPSFAQPFVDIAGRGSIPNKYPYSPPAAGSNVNFGFFEPFSLNVLNPNFTTPSAYNYNLTVERELPGAMILSMAYVGHQGRHLETIYELNPAGQAPGVNPVCAATPGCGPTNVGFLAPSTFKYDPTVFGSVGQQATDATSNYNALQVTLDKHFTHGLQFGASYTWSHSLDTISSFENVGSSPQPNPFNLRQNYGDSSYDARNRFVVNYIYELPSWKRGPFQRFPSRFTDGWKITGITTFQDGFPIGLTDGSNRSDTCFLTFSFYGCPDRPNLVGKVTLVDPRTSSFVNAIKGGTTARDHYFFDPNAFTRETRGVLGDSGRNFFHGPGINNSTFGLYKDTAITERARVELRIEFFNIFNHTQFRNPSGNVNSVNFGRVLSARDPRIIQLAAKFIF